MKIHIILIIYFFLIAKSFANELKTNHKIRMLQDPTDQGNSTGTIGTPILLGFGGFNKTKLQNEDTYSFQLKVFFQKIHDYVYKKYLFLKLKLKRGYLRSLDRDGDGDINVAAKLDDDSLNRDIIVYEIDDNNNGIGHKDFDSIDVYTKMTFKDNNAKIKDFNFEDCEDCDDVAIMAETENINDQKYDIDSFIFFNVLNLKTISPLHYEIIGNINIEKEINIDKNEKLTFHYQQYNMPKEFEATLSKYEENKKIYSLDFYIKDFIETSLNGAYAYLPKNWIKIRILEDDKTHKLILNEKNVSLYLVGSSPVPHSYSRKIASSSGLSGGAIAGIVIACVVVLIVIGLLFVYFNKPSPKSMDSSAIQFYNSSLSVVN